MTQSIDALLSTLPEIEARDTAWGTFYESDKALYSAHIDRRRLLSLVRELVARAGLAEALLKGRHGRHGGCPGCDDAGAREADLRERAEAAEAERDALKAERDEYIAKAADNLKLYLDLLMEVANVVPGETRHESAKRIIRQHETPSSNQCQGGKAISEGEGK